MNRIRQKERLAMALERIFTKFGFGSQPEMARALGFSQSTLCRAMNRSDSVYLSAENRQRVSNFLGRQCESEEELRVLVDEIGWDMSEVEWEEALTYTVDDEQVLSGIPRLSEGLMVGQEEEIEILRSWLLTESRTSEQVLVIQGTGGVGKTILALRTIRMRDVQERYQDNILWVDVETDGESGGIRRLARKMTRRKELQTEGPWSIVAEELRGKQALVVLDGVEGQIDLNRWGDLLPRQGRLLVTTRGIGVEGARVGARVLELTGLATGAARELLTRGVTVDVGEDELAWVLDGLECLPLALYIGNYVARLDGALSGFIDDLRDMGLGALAFGDQKGENIQVTFEVSYRRLNEKSRKVFQGLGVFLPRFRAGAVTDVLGLSEGAVRRGLRQLAQVGLAKSVGPGVYRMHSLVHRYAAELGQTDVKWTEWQERLAAYYLHVARKADTMQDFKMVGEYLADIFHGAVCALAVRNRGMVEDYVRYAGAYVSLDNSGALEAWQKWATGKTRQDAVVVLRAARFYRDTGRPDRALELAREAFDAAKDERECVEATLLTCEALLAMGHAAEAAEELKAGVLWERVARLDDGDDLVLQAWVVSERLRVMSGQDAGREEYAETARERWLASQPSPDQARLRLLRNELLSKDPEKALQSLKERMALAEKVGAKDAWMADALWHGALLVRQGQTTQAKLLLREAKPQEEEMADARFRPWVSLLEARVAWAMGQDEAGDRAYETAVGELAKVFGKTVFWPVEREGLEEATLAERAIAVWQRALQVDDPFRYVDTACNLYPVFVQQRGGAWADDEERAVRYRAARENIKSLGLDLPDWDWLVAEDDAAAEEEPPKNQSAQP